MASFFEAFQIKYLQKLGIRKPTFWHLFEHLERNPVTCILETGCLREIDNWEGDGQSTRLFDHYAAMTGSDFWSVDNDPISITAASKVCQHTKLVLYDSVRFLQNFNERVGLLYLDSFDLDEKNPDPAALHHLMELCAIRPCLKPGALVMVDDSPTDAQGRSTGKGAMVAQYMQHIGAKRLAFGYQDLWQMP